MRKEKKTLELTQGCKSSTASVSSGAPTETMIKSTVTSTMSSMGAEGTATATISSTMEGEMVDLEEAMMSQGDDNDDRHSKKYRTTSEDRTDRSVARAKQKEEHKKQEKE